MLKRSLTIFALFSALAGAQTYSPIVQPRVFFVDNLGNQCIGCKLYSYAAGTTTPQATYTDSVGGGTNTNPITLGTDGGATIWLGANPYKFVLKNLLGTTLWTVDNVPTWQQICQTVGCTMTGPLTSPQINKVYSAGATATTLQTAINSANSDGGGTVQLLPDTTYSGTIYLHSNVTLLCTDRTSVITIPSSDVLYHTIILDNDATNVTIKNCKIDGNGTNQNPTVLTPRKYGIYAPAGVTGLLLDNVEITNTAHVAIRLDGTSPHTVTNVTIDKMYCHDVGWNCSWIVENASNVKFTNSTFKNWGISTYSGGIFPGPAIDFSYIAGASTQSDVVISNNVIVPVTTQEFAIEDFNSINGLVVANNVLDGTQGSGYMGISMQANNAVFSNNTFLGGGQGHRSGFELVVANTIVANNNIQNGDITITGHGNNMSSASNVEVYGNTVGDAGLNDYCFDIGDQLSQVNWHNNTCKMTDTAGTNSGGLYLGAYGAAVYPISNIFFHHNQLIGNTTAISYGVRFFEVSGSSGIKIENNSFLNFQKGFSHPANSNATEVTNLWNDYSGSTTPIDNESTGGNYLTACNITVAGQTPAQVCAALNPTIPSATTTLSTDQVGTVTISSTSGYFIPNEAMTVTRLQYTFGTVPVGCSSWSLGLFDSSIGAAVAGTTANLSGAGGDTGTISAALTAGHIYKFLSTVGTGCGVNAVSPQPVANLTTTSVQVWNANETSNTNYTNGGTFNIPGTFTPSYAATVGRIGVMLNQAPSGCSVQPVVRIYDNTAAAAVTGTNVTIGAIPYFDSGALSAALIAGHTYQLQVVGGTGCSTIPVTVIGGNIQYTSPSVTWVQNAVVSGLVTTQSLKIASGTAMTANQGNGTSVQHSTGATTTNDLVIFDANGNAVDSGILKTAPTQSGSTPVVNTLACIKTVGPPVVLGYCSTNPAGGPPQTCTCL
jgi:hypothetical protein